MDFTSFLEEVTVTRSKFPARLASIMGDSAFVRFDVGTFAERSNFISGLVASKAKGYVGNVKAVQRGLSIYLMDLDRLSDAQRQALTEAGVL